MANFNFNKVIIAGRLTADPELRTIPSGRMVTSFSVAVNRRFSRNAEGQDNQPTADFFNVVAWAERAEFVSKYFRKGSSICVTGRLQNRNWTDQSGNKRYATDIVADEINFVDSKSDNPAAGSSDNYSAPSFSNEGNSAPDFEVMSGDQDLPF